MPACVCMLMPVRLSLPCLQSNARANKAAAAAAEKAGAEAAAAALQAEAAAERGGVRANLKFINPVKVPCTVTFNIKPRGVFAAGE